jgi:bis(5'-adenosyl)-triphosphatase
MKKFSFGPWTIPASEIFYNSKLSFGLTNLKPVVPGHVLVISRRVTPRFSELTVDEVTDLFKSVHLISKSVEKLHKAESLTITIQDGESAGQSVPHVHCHIIPRFKGDWLNNDDIYQEINEKERELALATARSNGDEQKFLELLKKQKGPDIDRVARTEEDMAQEASRLRVLFEQYENIWE